MLTADRMMTCAHSPASTFDDFQYARDKTCSKAKRLFMRSQPDDLLVRLASSALRQSQWHSIVRAVQEQEKRRLEGWAPHRLMRRLAAWIG
jgi:hypothetical protein